MTDLIAISKGEGSHLATVHALEDRIIYLTECGNDFTVHKAQGFAGVSYLTEGEEINCKRCRESGRTHYRRNLARLTEVRREEEWVSKQVDYLTQWLGLGAQNVPARASRASVTEVGKRKGAA